jgi:hypothetical protein
MPPLKGLKGRTNNGNYKHAVPNGTEIAGFHRVVLAKMALKHRTTTRVETRSLTVVRASREPVQLWCEACAAIVPMVTPERAAEMLRTNPRAIYRRVERGEVHFVETGAGELLICSDSRNWERLSWERGRLRPL